MGGGICYFPESGGEGGILLQENIIVIFLGVGILVAENHSRFPGGNYSSG